MRRRQRPSSVTVLWDVRRTTLSIWNLVDKYFRWETEIESAAFRTWRKVRGGDTSMAGMAIATPGGLHISKTGYTMGKIRWHRGKKTREKGQKTYHLGKKTGVCILAIPAKVGQCRPWQQTTTFELLELLSAAKKWILYLIDAIPN